MKQTKKELTPYDDVNGVLMQLADGLAKLLGDDLLGLYLTGSLTYGDFDLGSSDIDFLAVIKQQLSDEQLKKIKALHESIAQAVPVWAKRLEGSYITKGMIRDKRRPTAKRPYINAGKINFYQYGNEWTINLHALQECGVAIIGPPPKQIFPAVDINDVRTASREDLINDWLPKLEDPKAFNVQGYDSNHLKAYTVLTMCRILYRAKNDGVASKRVASAWAKEKYGESWASLVETAENWQHGKQMSSDDKVKDFIRFTQDQIGA